MLIEKYQIWNPKKNKWIVIENNINNSICPNCFSDNTTCVWSDGISQSGDYKCLVCDHKFIVKMVDVIK